MGSTSAVAVIQCFRGRNLFVTYVGGANRYRYRCSQDRQLRYRSPSVVVAIHRFQGSEGTVWICHGASAELDAQPSPPLRQKRATNARREQAAIVLAGRFRSRAQTGALGLPEPLKTKK